jgi:F-type H+-transporting ATPase subunit gamma
VSGLKAIRRRIQSVKNTKQITRAMKLVSAAKLRRAQEAAEGGRAFGKRLQELLTSILCDLPEGFSHPLLEKKEIVKKKRILLIAGERGLCGAYNSNVIKAAEAFRKSSSVPVDFVLLGKRAKQVAARFEWDVVAAYEGLAEDAGLWPISEISSVLVDGFKNGDCDEVVVISTFFRSAMSQEVETKELLPFAAPVVDDVNKISGVIKYDPMPEILLANLIPLLVTTNVCQAGLESKASEHAARMTAMDSATRNADDLIEKLRLFYNRARQTAITRELIDIVGGAEALK